MRLIRPAVAMAVGVSLVLAGSAGAAPKKKPLPCNLVTDPAGDAPGNMATDGQDDAFDITSIDVATDKANITAVMRIKALKATSSNSPEGMRWGVDFTVDANVFTMAAHAGPSGVVAFDASYEGTTGGSIYGPGVTGVFDTAKNEVRITAPLSLFAEQAVIRKGTKITAITGASNHEVAAPDPTPVFGGYIFTYPYYPVDSTEGGKDYVGEGKSCVVVGK